MNYEIAFWCLLTACVTKFITSNKFYIGPDRSEYEKADFAILLRSLR